MYKKSFSFKVNKNFNKSLIWQYIVLLFFWVIFIIFLLTVLILFINEKNSKSNEINNILNMINKSNDPSTISNLYQQLVNIKYPLIDFALMSFVFAKPATPISNWQTAWEERLKNINIAYSYIFITTLIAIIGFCFYLFLIFKIYRRSLFEKKHNLSTNFSNEYTIYDIKIYLSFVINLAIVFSFFNFLSTLITLVYGLVLVISSYFLWYVLKQKTEVLVSRRWWKSPNFILFLSILLIQNGISILKVFFTAYFSVNLDLILNILFPIGTITVMITLLIKNMLNSKVSSVIKSIKSINSKVTSFRIFYYTQREKSLEDYTFVSQLPKLVANPLKNNSINKDEAFKLMALIDETVLFFEENIKVKKELNYMLFHLFNEIVDKNEITEIKENILKIKNKV